MRETGAEFDVVAKDGRRFRLAPVVSYGRAPAPGRRRPTLRSWSVWTYWLADQPETEAIPVRQTKNTERPERFTIRLGRGPLAAQIEVTTFDERRLSLRPAA